LPAGLPEPSDWSNHHAVTLVGPKPPTGHCRMALSGSIWCQAYLDPERVGVKNMSKFVRRLWSEEEGQDIAEYAVMLAVILVIVVGTIRLIGGNANNVFSSVSSSIGS
jgi:Flp pilus assembly pilin Flp